MNLCSTCFAPVTFTEDDLANNTARLKEQASFRKKDESFNFRFRATCEICGTVFIDKVIKNVKFKANQNGLTR